MKLSLVLLINIIVVTIFINIKCITGASFFSNSREIGKGGRIWKGNNNNDLHGRLTKRQINFNAAEESNESDYTYDDWIANKIDDWWWNSGSSTSNGKSTVQPPPVDVETTTRRNWYPSLPISRFGNTEQ